MIGLDHVAMNATEKNVPSNRLPYNSRQRQPSTESDTSSGSDNNRSMEGPGANEYKFTETTHSDQVNHKLLKVLCIHL